MMVISGAALVLADRVLDAGSVVIDGERIVAIESRAIDAPAGATRVDASGTIVVPGFIDVHVHGIEGVDVLDGADAVARVASRLPRYGVTAFCPTTVACPPVALDGVLAQLEGARPGGEVSARVLPAHLESNFINPRFKGAQPLGCLRTPLPIPVHPPAHTHKARADEAEFSGADILEVIGRRRHQIAIVTVAPEIEGGLDFVQQLTAAGYRVSVGHSGATYEQTIEAVAAGVCHATHLFNRMSGLNHRAPGVVGAVLHSEDVAAEVICDGFHVHPALIRLTVRAKGIANVMAITDGTAGSGLPVGSRTRLGSQPIVVTERTAELEDGTFAGSVLTMDGAFRQLVGQVGLSVRDAARLCSTSPAEQLRLPDLGKLAPGYLADLVILDRETLRVRSTVINGQIWRNTGSTALV
ncbi:MAG TPA: N-acetylglucosamine-6-phosphate deacetylase [Vicinamibacterales bacterium]|nr:N-acetylglucosamine-6-phosphate deacetylase [Vicinamibacterales bacterium]